MKSSIDSRDRSEMLTRRTATVTISAPEASCACTITALEGYLPVPTMRRDVKVRPARTKASIALASTHEVHDLDLVAVVPTDRPPAVNVIAGHPPPRPATVPVSSTSFAPLSSFPLPLLPPLPPALPLPSLPFPLPGPDPPDCCTSTREAVNVDPVRLPL